MKVTIHNGRTGKEGVYNPKHNDRNFDLSNAEHIDPERTKNNWYWNCFDNPNMSFEEVERNFYEEHCAAHLKAQNERYIRQRHKERVRTLDEYRTSWRTCPEETILMVGNKDEYIPRNTLQHICEDFRNWEEKTFPGLHVLDMALHVDEEGAHHIHERKIWLYIDKQGNEAVGQNQALEQAKIELPYPDKPRGRYNNRKQTFSKIAREKFVDICRNYGLRTLEEPSKNSRSGLTLIQYMTEQEMKKVSHLQKQEDFIASQLEIKKKEYREVMQELEQAKDFLHKTEERKIFNLFYERERERERCHD